MISPEVFEPRNESYALTYEQQSMADAVSDLLSNECTPSHVRAAASQGFSPQLWAQLRLQGLLDISLPPDQDGVGLIELTLVAEALGQALAPVPFPEASTAINFLAGLDNSLAAEFLEDMLAGRELVTVEFRQGLLNGGITATGAVSRRFLTPHDDKLLLIETGALGTYIPNVGALPFATANATKRQAVLAEGEVAFSAVAALKNRWRILTAARLVGLIRIAQRLAVEFAKTRMTRGVSIGTLQGVSFPLADTEIGYATARNLVHRAAWYLENEPASHPELAPSAFLHAARAALQAAEASVQTHGGMGVATESDISLVFERVQAWAWAQGNRGDLIDELGQLIAVPPSAGKIGVRAQ